MTDPRQQLRQQLNDFRAALQLRERTPDVRLIERDEHDETGLVRKRVDLDTDGQTIPAFVLVPKTKGPWPAMVVQPYSKPRSPC
jgi:hypothetical protein